MDYDVLILGGGIIGCALAYELSKYNLNIAVVEKDYDIGSDTALINTATIYDGLESEDELSSKLIRKGNLMIEEYASKFNVPYKRCGSIYVAKDAEQEEFIDNMYKRAQKKKIEDVKLLEGEDIFKLEKNLDREIKKILYIPNTGVLRSYDLALAYGEIAFDNGVKFKLEEEVESIEKLTKGFKVETNKNKFTCKIVINTTLDERLTRGYDNKPERVYNKNYLKYIMLDKKYEKLYSNIIFDIKGKERIYIRPTIVGGIIGAYSNDKNVSYDRVIRRLSPLLKSIDSNRIKMVLDWHLFDEPVRIDNSVEENGYINVEVRHYGQVTMTPALALNICNLVVGNLNCKLKKDFIDKRREYYKFRELSSEEVNEIIKLDNKYGKIICACEGITEGEIVDAIRRPLGARTLEGIKRRTGAGFGSCRGCYCNEKIISILARETGKKITEIVKHSKNSRVILGRIKEFDTM
ncbi:Monomeric sarcosine oxidase [bioreactor metagenome]|uniref:Monomeric sarcosine oxidase n=1 Tax=bioreactor metagenome TaxID=1076179 RepID=A0A644ZI73_9ZZZZ